MKNQVALVYKKSSYQIYFLEKKDPQICKLIEENNPLTRHFKQSHQANLKCGEELAELLHSKNISSHSFYRADLMDMANNGNPYPLDQYDLTIAIGGDGTFLEASHFIKDSPLIGFNSNPISSVGHYCLKDLTVLDEILNLIFFGKTDYSFNYLKRFNLRKNGKLQKIFPLNDILYCSLNPASTSRYIIEIEGFEPESQRSSGIWTSTPTGSSGAVASAGGPLLNWQNNEYQFLVREPSRNCFELTQAKIPADKILTITSKMRKARVFIDGSHEFIDLDFADKIELKLNAPNLKTIFPTSLE